MNKTEKPLARLQYLLEHIASAVTTEPEHLIDYVLKRVKALDVKIQRDSPKLVNQVTDIKLTLTSTGVLVEYEIGKCGCSGQLNVAIHERPVFDSLSPKHLEKIKALIADLSTTSLVVQHARQYGKESGYQAFHAVKTMTDRGVEFILTDRIEIHFLDSAEGVIDVDFVVTPVERDDYKKVYVPNSNGGYPCL